MCFITVIFFFACGIHIFGHVHTCSVFHFTLCFIFIHVVNVYIHEYTRYMWKIKQRLEKWKEKCDGILKGWLLIWRYEEKERTPDVPLYTYLMWKKKKKICLILASNKRWAPRISPESFWHGEVMWASQKPTIASICPSVCTCSTYIIYI